jgi:sirohydrochlorin ferrochelatase
MTENKRALLIVAHGSRREASNDEVRELTKVIAGKAGARFIIVATAFLELATPSIPDGIEQCIQAGANEVVVLPYFLSAGRHVAHDIPTEVEIKRVQYPHVPITIAAYLGSDSGVADLMMGLVN